MYYSTVKAIYKTIDGGDTWVVKKTPTTRVAGEIMVHSDPEKSAQVFVGAKELLQ